MEETTALYFTLTWADQSHESVVSEWRIRFREWGSPDWVTAANYIPVQTRKASVTPSTYDPPRIYDVCMTAVSGETESDPSEHADFATLSE